jgi:adenylate cyclase
MTAASPNRRIMDNSKMDNNANTITIDATVVNPQVDGNHIEQKSASAPPAEQQAASTSSSALAATQGTFKAFLAPLNKENFKQVVTDVENKLEVVNQTLTMLDSLLDAQGFDSNSQ